MKNKRKINLLAAFCTLFFLLSGLLIWNTKSTEKNHVAAMGETVTLNVLGWAGSSLNDYQSEYSVYVENAEEFHSTMFTGKITVNGQEKDAVLLISDSIATFFAEIAIDDSYFIVDEKTNFVANGVSIVFDQTYVMSFEQQMVFPVSVVYNPMLESWGENELTASCGVSGNVYSSDYASGVVMSNGEPFVATLQVDAGDGKLIIQAPSLPETFIIDENTVFLSSTAAYCFDVEYIFDKNAQHIVPTDITLSFFDGKDLVCQLKTKVGESVVLPSADLFKGAGLRLGLSDGEKLYQFGAEFTAKSTANFTVEYLSLTTQDEACARLVAPFGVRFTTGFLKSEYQSLEKLDGVSLDFGAEIGVYGSDKKVVIPTAAVSMYEKDSQICYHTAIVGIKEENFALVYQCTPTVTLTYSNGQVEEFFGQGTTEGRSYAQVLQNAYEELTEYDEETQDVVCEQREKVFSSERIKPAILVYENGERISSLQGEINELRASLTLKIGQQIDLTDFFKSCAPDGGSIDENKSVLVGVLTERGLTIEVYYTK